MTLNKAPAATEPNPPVTEQGMAHCKNTIDSARYRAAPAHGFYLVLADFFNIHNYSPPFDLKYRRQFDGVIEPRIDLQLYLYFLESIKRVVPCHAESITIFKS